jgi:hypothetical protein
MGKRDSCGSERLALFVFLSPAASTQTAGNFLDAVPGKSFIRRWPILRVNSSLRKTAYIRWRKVLLHDATMRARNNASRAGRSWLPTTANRIARLAALATLLTLSFPACAQWLSQSFTLKPGWNAIFTHVDVSHQSLDSLVPDANGPVAEVWLWKPTFSTVQFVDTPYTNAVPNSQWAVWTSARGDTDTLTTLVGNGAYLVNNRTGSDFVWTVKGKAVPPSYQWTTTGLNFLGFPTPSNSPPSFATYLTPAPGLDLSKTLQNQARVFRYPGGNLGSTNPVEVVSFNASTTPVTRGQAFWVRGSTNYYNHYYGPVEVVLQNTAGIQYRDTLGTYSLRLKNLTTTSRTVAFNLVASENPPAGQPAIVATPQLLVRGDLSTTTLTYNHTVLAGQQFTLAPVGQAGSELEVVLGLNRSLMTAPSGSLYAGILRITDTAGLQQTDVPVSATVPNASGLWVGSASINQVGQYLKTYSKVDTTQADQTAQINAAAAAASRPPNGAELPGSAFVARETNVFRGYSAVASSLDGRTLVAAAATNGALYVSQDFGTNWTARDTNRSWSELACSADGSVMAGAVFNGAIYVSSDSGASWTAAPGTVNFTWAGIACSADGNALAAVVTGGPLYTSANRATGAAWRCRRTARGWRPRSIPARFSPRRTREPFGPRGRPAGPGRLSPRRPTEPISSRRWTAASSTSRRMRARTGRRERPPTVGSQSLPPRMAGGSRPSRQTARSTLRTMRA